MSDRQMAERTTGAAGDRPLSLRVLVDQFADDCKETTMDSVQIESSGKLAALAKCAHPDCTCTVTDGERYCSDFCLEISQADSAKDADGCSCGHPECTATVGAGLAPVGPFTS